MIQLETNLEESNRERIWGLDLYRSIAIILVVFTHGAYLLEKTPFEGFPFIKMLDGVDLFFVLSGFLIGGILLKDITSTSGIGFKKLFNFWKRRWLRTLPNYYLILLINYLFIKNKIIIENITQFNWKFLFFLQNFSKPFCGFFWESWSLSVEEWFYLMVPPLLFLIVKITSAKKSFLIVTLLMICVPFIIRYFDYNISIDNFWYDVTVRKIVIKRLDSIAYGLLSSWLFFYYAEYWEKYKILALVVSILLIVFLVNFKSDNTTFFKQITFFSLTPLAAMLLIPFFQGINNKNSVFYKSITHISKISYSMYLINLALVSEVIRDNFPPTSIYDRIVKYCIYWFLVICFSTFLYKFYEKPFMKLRGT